jgi:transcriptional regulator with XRE-family HTH domain
MGEGELGLMLRRLRGVAGLTQEELAERAGVSVRAISDIERWQRSAVYAATARRLADALELDPRTRSRFEAAARGRRAADERSWSDRGSVPVPPTRIIGREAELSALAARCGCEGARLLTLIGVGGVGKTRLAIEVARAVAAEFGPRVTFVQLGETRDAAVVPSLVARALGISAREPVGEHVAAHIGSDRRLLVLDTFEHVLDAAAGVAALLAGCPGLVVLATSREPLRLRGEFVFRVDSLAAPVGRPSNMAELETNAAGELFLERARAACAGLAFSAEDPGIVAEICRRLEGLPLALELAAARVRLLPLSALRDQLEHRLPLLTGGLRDGPPRQRTMRETIAWSYMLLGESQQDLVRRLSVFAGFTLEALDTVWSARTATRPTHPGSGCSTWSASSPPSS